MMRMLRPEGQARRYNAGAEFISICEQARLRARQVDNDAVNYMADHLPIYPAYQPTPAQKMAAGYPADFPDPQFWGLWMDQAEGYPYSLHGHIWLFEVGIRAESGRRNIPVVEHAYEVLIHEMEHALQEDHVLDAMEQQKRNRANGRGCGACGGR